MKQRKPGMLSEPERFRKPLPVSGPCSDRNPYVD
jgi:hypothetical protein